MIDESDGFAMAERAGRAALPGFQLQLLAETSSTQDVVRGAARAGAAAGFCCVAESQTAGRGRQGRIWSAPPGGALLASVLVRVDPPAPAGVSISAGLALRAAIAATSGCECLLRWPNDLVVRDAKLAGILCEIEPAATRSGTAVAVGVGVNLRVDSFPPDIVAISLHQVVDDPPSPLRLLASFVEELAARLVQLDGDRLGPLRDEWMRHAAGIGEMVTIASPSGTVTGVAEGVDDGGALLIRTPQRTVRVLAGDVHLVADDT